MNEGSKDEEEENEICMNSFDLFDVINVSHVIQFKIPKGIFTL